MIPATLEVIAKKTQGWMKLTGIILFSEEKNIVYREL